MLQKIKAFAEEELEFGALRLLMPVFFGFGILLYFFSPDEPNLWTPITITLILSFILWRIKKFSLRICLCVLTLIAAGFSAASIRAHLARHPVLAAPTRTIDITGRIEKIERRENNDRVTLFVHEMPDVKLERVRVVARQRVGFNVGDDVSVKARLLPPSEPSRPGGYDFARDSWFNGLAAVGFTLGDFKKAEPRPITITAWFQIKIETIRQTISNRIRFALAGETGAMADALVTGRRDGLSLKTQDALRAAGTYHILSISGFHMTLVAAFIFAMVRGAFALFPTIAQRFNVKAIAGAVAFTIAGFYNVLAGSEVATVRSWLMIAFVLLGVMLSRSAFTVFTLSNAAMIILIFAPETLLSPSFQMSFAATLVLVAGFKGAQLTLEKYADENSVFQKIGVTVTSGIIGLASASFFAGLATMPFTAYHFHQIQNYGLFGNLIGAPIIEFFVMPLEIIALLVWPFGFDLWLWPAIGKAIDLFLQSAHWIATWPGNTFNVPVFSGISLAFGALGFIILLVLRTRLRFIGFALMVVAGATASISEKPFLLSDSSGNTVAIVKDGVLFPVTEKPVMFVLNEWRQAFGLELGKGEGACDAYGCLYQVNQLSILKSKSVNSLIEDCELSTIIISDIAPPLGCKAYRLPKGGAALYANASGFRIDATRQKIGNRLWQSKPKQEATINQALPYDATFDASLPD